MRFSLVQGCPECRGVLYPRDGTSRARHFYHVAENASCSSVSEGESETHARCTALAVAALDGQYPDADHVGAEVTLDVSNTETTPETRRADALVAFIDSNPYFGNGLIIEVQHKHHSKDIEGTTHDYLSAGFSVAWLTPRDFGEEHLSYEVVDKAFRADDGRAYSVHQYDPWEFDSQVETNLSWDKPTSRECNRYAEFNRHWWKRIPGYAHPDGYEYEFCPACGLRRKYNQKLTRFVYDSEGVLAPRVGIEILRNAVIPYPESAANFDEWKAGDGIYGRSFENSLTTRVDVAPCRGPKRIHEWMRKEVIERRFDDRVDVALWECRHCPVHLLINNTGNGETKYAILFGDAPKPEWGLEFMNGNPWRCTDPFHSTSNDWDYCATCFAQRQ